jgi:hypothetical protein
MPAMKMTSLPSCGSLGAPRRLARLARVGFGDRLEGLVVEAGIFQRLAERMAHRDEVGRTCLGFRQRGLQLPAIVRRQRLRLDVRQATPGIAAGGLGLDDFAIARRGFVEAAQVHERIAEQHLRRPHLFGQRGGTLQRLDRGLRFAAQLQVAAEVEPAHRVVRLQLAGATPARQRGVHFARGIERAAQVGMQQGVFGPAFERAAQGRQAIPRAAGAGEMDAEQAQHFRMTRRGSERFLQQALGGGRLAIADGARGALQALHYGGRQAGHARVVGRKGRVDAGHRKSS